MAVSAERVTVGTSAVALNTASTAGLTLVIKNVGATFAADLGPSAVTSGAGFDVPVGATVTVEVDAGDVLFAISSSTGTTLAVLRT